MLFTLLVYATGDKEAAAKHGIDLKKGILTHATTNLSATELESKYGNRLRSRMREIFNLVPFDKNSMDKRR